jgi:hypothetical protein
MVAVKDRISEETAGSDSLPLPPPPHFGTEAGHLDSVGRTEAHPHWPVQGIAESGDEDLLDQDVDEEAGSKSDDSGEPPPIDEALLRYTVCGPGIVNATMRQPTRFRIEATAPNGQKVSTRGMSFFIAIRGVARVRAKVVSEDNDAYNVEWKPSVSGLYSITISKAGRSLRGSPFSVNASTPLPLPRNCLVSPRCSMQNGSNVLPP